MAGLRVLAGLFPLTLMHLKCLAPLLFWAVLPLRGEAPPPPSPALAGALRKSGLPAGAESVSVPLEFTFAGFIVELHVDEKPVRLVLDSGASSTILSPDMAKKLGLKAEVKGINIRSANGRIVTGRLALTKRLSLGEAWTENEPVLVAEMIPGVNGMLGLATLADWDVRIDPSTKTLSLFPAGTAPPLEGETVLPLTCLLVLPEAETSHGQSFRPMNLRVPVRVGTHVVSATPDTGAGDVFQLSSVLMEKVAPEAMKHALPGLTTGIALSGKTVSRDTKIPEFTFGDDTLRGLPTTVITAPPGSSTESKGLVGLNLLRHYVMTFRFAAGELRLKSLGTVQEITQVSTAGIHLDLGDKILSVVPGGPADKAGLRAGDEMLEIEGNPLKTMTPEKFATLKRLPPGTVVKVRYRRGELSPVETRLVLVKE